MDSSGVLCFVSSCSLVSQWIDDSAAYCPGAFIQKWECGPACDALPRPVEVAIGGDGESTPRCQLERPEMRETS
jgi:hypothetical protein